MQALIHDRKYPGLPLSSGEKLIEELIKVTGWDPEFYELRIPLLIVASDKVSQRNVILRHGKVFDAVRASLAMPLLLEEKQMGGMQLADGAIFAPLDTKTLYAEGADFVIAIQAKPIHSATQRKLPLGKKAQPHVLRMLGWQTSKEIYFSKPACDILLRPRVPKELAKDISRVGEIINLGIKITYEAIHGIEEGNYPKHVMKAEQLQKINEESISKANLDMENEISDFEIYIEELEKRTTNLTDGELVEVFPKFANKFQTFLNTLSIKYPDPQVASQEFKKRLGNLKSILDQNPYLSRVLEKPLGYAGDYQMMNYIYDNELFDANSNMGKLFNFLVYSNPTTNAVRNRAKILKGIIQQRVFQLKELSLASIACGPAREVAETVKSLSENTQNLKLRWTLLDQDKEALDYARENMPDQKMLDVIYINASVKDLIKKEITLGQQDIIYSLGLFDYLNEKVATIMINRLYTELNPGGLLLIGNFHPSNPLRVFMEGALEWFLIHRTEDELLAIGKAGAPEGRHFVMAEPEGVNLIMVTTKPLDAKS